MNAIFRSIHPSVAPRRGSFARNISSTEIASRFASASHLRCCVSFWNRLLPSGKSTYPQHTLRRCEEEVRGERLVSVCHKLSRTSLFPRRRDKDHRRAIRFEGNVEKDPIDPTHFSNSYRPDGGDLANGRLESVSRRECTRSTACDRAKFDYCKGRICDPSKAYIDFSNSKRKARDVVSLKLELSPVEISLAREHFPRASFRAPHSGNYAKYRYANFRETY